MINADISSVIDPLLEAGETVLWSDRPAKRLDVVMLFGLLAGIVGMFVVSPDAPLYMLQGLTTLSYGVLFLTAIILFGLFWIIRAIFLPGREYYALTNQRVIIHRTLFPKSTASIPVAEITKAKATKQGRYGRVALMMRQVGPFTVRKYKGSLGFVVPFFRTEGFILQALSDADSFMRHLGELRPGGHET